MGKRRRSKEKITKNKKEKRENMFKNKRSNRQSKKGAEEGLKTKGSNKLDKRQMMT